jgi:gliding motility-associated lipoprotein GldD
MRRFEVVSICALTLLALGCRDTPVPLPRGYFRIELPEPAYVTDSSPSRLAFQRPVYARVGPGEFRDSASFFTLDFPTLDAQVFVAHFPLHSDLDAHVAAVHGEVATHEIKASGIGRRRFAFPAHRVYGVFFDLEGPVATPIHLYATDSVNHFLHATLYFNHRPNPDSIAPALERVQADMERWVETLTWP